MMIPWKIDIITINTLLKLKHKRLDSVPLRGKCVVSFLQQLDETTLNSNIISFHGNQFPNKASIKS